MNKLNNNTSPVTSSFTECTWPIRMRGPPHNKAGVTSRGESSKSKILQRSVSSLFPTGQTGGKIHNRPLSLLPRARNIMSILWDRRKTVRFRFPMFTVQSRLVQTSECREEIIVSFDLSLKELRHSLCILKNLA